MESSLTIKSLGDTGYRELTDCVNRAFADYSLKFTATEEYIRERTEGAGGILEASVGAFDGERLVGFLLNALGILGDTPAAFDVMTGIEPAYRGKGALGAMFATASPLLRARGAEKYVVEVLQNNTAAIRAYSKLGLKQTREFRCFKGEPQVKKTGFKTELCPAAEFDFAAVREMWSYAPSWENTVEALLRTADAYEVAFIREDGRLSGYAAYHTVFGMIPQIAVREDCRGEGRGNALIAAVAAKCPRVAINNIDSHDESTIRFAEGAGLTNYADQYQLELLL